MLRRRILVTGLTGVAVLAIGTATGAAALAGHPGSVPVSPSGDKGSSLTQDCVEAAAAQGESLPNPHNWRSGADFGIGSPEGFLTIRDDKYAAVCDVENGKAAGLMGGFDAKSRHNYDRLTTARPFDFLDAMNYPDRTIMFGIATQDVVSLSLIGPDGSVTPATVHDGTFVAVTKFGEDSGQPTTNHVRATLKDGTVVTGPLRD